MPTNKSHSASQVYLLIYNTVCAALWLYILLAAASTLISSRDVSAVYTSLEAWTRCAQTLAVAEILHAATGIYSS
jgi:very-long-chain (3R)-3-hydroxyacyl-CoA dehydratase